MEGILLEGFSQSNLKQLKNLQQFYCSGARKTTINYQQLLFISVYFTCIV